MVAIIPARSGSKGLKGKNIKNLLDKPLIAYTIEAALKSKYISDVIISTDSQKIAKISQEYGAKNLFLRPKELAEDSSLIIDTYLYTIKKLISEFNYSIDNFIVLQPTSPLRSTQDIDQAIELFKIKNADSVISYTQESHPISWNKYITENLTFENIFPEKISNRQDERISYYPNGAIFIYKYQIIQEKKFYTQNSYAYLMPRNKSVDIDTIDDFNYVEYLMRKERGK